MKEEIANLIGEAMIAQVPNITCPKVEAKALEARDNAVNNILSLISEEIEKVGNPYTARMNDMYMLPFENCRQKILALLNP